MSGRQTGSVESYAHKAAKAAVVSWLRDAAVLDEWVKAAGISWRVNRGAPWFGIWEEYPVVNGEDCCVWDESGWWRDLEGVRIHRSRQLAHALCNIGWHTLKGFYRSYSGRIVEDFWREDDWISQQEAPWLQGRQPIPTYDELIEMGTPPQVILDVAVQHKGCITAGIEIVHKHGLTNKKREYLRQLNCTTYVVPADWVLAQVRPPDRLVVIEAVNYVGRGDDIVLATARSRRRRVWA